MKLLLPLSLAGVIALSGCTWFTTDKTANTPDDSNASSTSDASGATVNGDATLTGTQTGEHELSRPELGFATSYSGSFTIQETSSCTEGCPAGTEVPAFLFGNAARPDVVSLTVYPDADRFLLLNYSSASDLEAYLSSSSVRDLTTTPIANGTHYAYTIVGETQELPGLFPDTQDRQAHLLVSSGGRVYSLIVEDEQATSLAAELAANFSLL